MNCQCHRHTVYQFIYCMYICTLHTHTKYNFCLSPKKPRHPFGDIQPHWECIICKHHFHIMGEKAEPWRDWLTCSRPHTQKRQTPGPSLISLHLQFKLSAHPFPRNDKWEGKGQLPPSCPLRPLTDPSRSSEVPGEGTLRDHIYIQDLAHSRPSIYSSSLPNLCYQVTRVA